MERGMDIADGAIGCFLLRLYTILLRLPRTPWGVWLCCMGVAWLFLPRIRHTQ